MRSSNIDDAVKVTLYMPRTVSESAKVFAGNAGTSMSRLVTQLLIERMTGVVQHTVEVGPELQKKLERSAKQKGVLVSDLITALLDELTD